MSVLNQRRPIRSDEGENPKADVINAALNTAVRRRKPQNVGKIEAFLTTFEYAPVHLKDNRYIIRGYRAGYSVIDAIKSAFSIHNETGNIWTHLIGFLIFVFLTIATITLKPAPLRLGTEAITAVEQRLFDYGKTNMYELLASAEAWERSVLRYGSDKLNTIEEALRSIGKHNLAELSVFTDVVTDSARGVGKKFMNYSKTGIAELVHLEGRLANFSSDAIHDVESALHRGLASILDATWPVNRWPMYVFTIGAMLCLFISAMCHLFGCCAIHISSTMWRFDYAGIAVLIVASFYPTVYYCFLCKPVLRLSYLTITTLFGLSTLSVTLMEKFQDPKLHVYRATLFCSLGLWGIVPLVHGYIILGDVSVYVNSMRLDLLMGAIYLLGATIYASRIPERWKPGAFDVAFHSHQLFHIAVVIAAMIHYKSSRQLMEWRDMTGGCLAL